MQKILFCLIFVLVALTSVSLAFAGAVDDVDNFDVNDAQSGGAIDAPEWDGPNVDNYQFEGDYSTPEEIDGCLPINAPDEFNDADFETITVVEDDEDYEPCIVPIFEVVNYNIDGDVITLTLLVTNQDTGLGFADSPITLQYGDGETWKLASTRTDENGYATFTVPYNSQVFF